ncbi:MAG: Cytochrome c family protein, partial [Myxococcaceae bacterium]|nr:Cytochrome c family protein [Myxococcaceae bacterium]
AAGPSHAIYPTQRLPLRFHHARHLALPGVTCARCHTAAAASARVEDDLLPAESTCAPCHAIDRAHPASASTAANPLGGCDLCHEGWRPEAPMRVARAEVPAANLRFSHARHAAANIACERCHVGVRAVGLATRLELPTMATCVTCHRPGGAPDRCAVCHLTEPDGRLRTRFGDEQMNPPTWMNGLHHDADFWFTHRASAAADSNRCAVCHTEGECAACHDGRVRDRRTHPNDYVTMHAVDARMNSDRCGSCHRASTFCVACHQRMGVAPSSPTLARAFGRFHPPAAVWTSAPVTLRHHGAEARRAMRTCTSCHSEQDCVACHATLGRGGGGFSPHPPSFLARCGALLRASERPCALCHDDLDAVRARCR